MASSIGATGNDVPLSTTAVTPSPTTTTSNPTILILPVPTHFVLVQHGSHGRSEHLKYVTEHLLALGAGSIRPWSSYKNERRETDKGTLECAQVVWQELLPVLDQFIADVKRGRKDSAVPINTSSAPPPPPPNAVEVVPTYFSVIGHSWGGILIRELAYRVSATFGGTFIFHTFASLATPHLGISDLNPVIQTGARFIGNIRSKTYLELLVDSPILVDRLVDDEHLAALSRFKNRFLYANTDDSLVSFETSSLTTDAELCQRLRAQYVLTIGQPAGDAAHPHVRPALDPSVVFRDGPFLTPRVATVGSAAPPSMGVDGSCVDVAKEEGLPSDAAATTAAPVSPPKQPALTAPCAGTDPIHIDKQRRINRARARLLAFGGSFTVHPVYFPERFVIPHAAIIGRMPIYGAYFQDVSDHVAMQCASFLNELDSVMGLGLSSGAAEMASSTAAAAASTAASSSSAMPPFSVSAAAANGAVASNRSFASASSEVSEESVRRLAQTMAERAEFIERSQLRDGGDHPRSSTGDDDDGSDRAAVALRQDSEQVMREEDELLLPGAAPTMAPDVTLQATA